MNVKLTEIKEADLKSAYIMHFRCFLPMFIKYLDWKHNPIFTKFSRFKELFQNENVYVYFIECDGKRVGQIWLVDKKKYMVLGRLCVLGKYQNKGIATKAILIAEELFADQTRWWLNTIKEEKNNCHLYEKLGYRPIGNDKKINRRMTTTEYVKG